MTRTSGEGHSFGRSWKRIWKRERIPALLGACFLGAVLYGALLSVRAGNTVREQLSFLMDETLSAGGDPEFVTLFRASFLPALLYWSVAFLLGFFALGQPFGFFLMAFRGLGLGLSMGQLYGDHLGEGILYCAVFLVPSAVLSALVLIAAFRDALQSSNLFWKRMFSGSGEGATAGTLRLYLMRYLVYLLLLAAAAALHALIGVALQGILTV